MILKKNKKLRIVIAVVVCLAAFVAIRNTLLQEKHSVLPPLVRTMVVSETGDTSEYSYPGEVCSQYESQLAFQVSGKISRKNVDVGDAVQAGDILLEIDAQDVAQIENINSAAVASAQSKYQLAKDNFDRFSQLYEQGAASRLDYDNSENAYNTAKAALAQANATYAQSSNQLSYCQLRADKPGVVADVNVEEGQVVSAGQKVVTVVQDTALEVEINVPENKIDAVKSAKKLTISFWALPDIKTDGVISEVSPMADPASRTYKVKIALVHPLPDIKVGMSSTVSLDSDHAVQDIFIPLEAVYQTTSSPAVWIVKNGKVSLKEIKTTEFSGNNVEITSGLKPGDTIVTAGVHKLSEGQRVRTERDEQ
jgi:RND family efflux transporter, MFP subunit